MSGITMFESALIGHLVGDYILQNDRQAANKFKNSWWCLLHVSLYTLAVIGLLSLHDWRWLNPAWPALVAVPHFLMDRFRLARHWMTFNGQEAFATNAMAPWSIVVVDNVIHLVCLYATVAAFGWWYGV